MPPDIKRSELENKDINKLVRSGTRQRWSVAPVAFDQAAGDCVPRERLDRGACRPSGTIPAWRGSQQMQLSTYFAGR